ncbi:MAG: amidohydrolase [bacterium]|nr:amidohydrolase [bacterium]
MSLWLKNVIHGEDSVTIQIVDEYIVKIYRQNDTPIISTEDEVIEGNHSLRVLPSLFNGHTHASMTLFRSYGDDLPLMRWLQEKIWPLENGITEEFVEWGMRLAILEMIKTGTTGFNDMYWHYTACAKVVEEMGIHGVLSGVFVDLFDNNRAKEQQQLNEELYWMTKERFPKYVQFAIGPHAIYTVSENSLRWAAEFTETHQLPLHIHLAETEHEVIECKKQHQGKSPVEYLNSLHLVSPRLKAAHVIHVSDQDRAILSEKQATVIHNPTSNMKLAVGGPFNLPQMLSVGIQPILGTDGAGSNNSLDMFQEMKIAALLQKHAWGDPEVAPANTVWEMATKHAWKQFGYNAGEIAEGKLAEIILVNEKDVSMVPDHNYISNLVYSANGHIVDTTISSGRVLMKHRKVKGEEEIIQEFCKIAKKFVQRKHQNL